MIVAVMLMISGITLAEEPIRWGAGPDKVTETDLTTASGEMQRCVTTCDDRGEHCDTRCM